MSHHRRSAEAHPRVPADDVPHARTWMSWPSRRGVWGLRLGGVQEDIALIARTIAQFEPVVMCAPDDWTADKARARCGPAVEVITAIPTDDLWMRDIAPVFRRDGYGGLEAVVLNFNGWGNKQVHHDDARAAERLAAHRGLRHSFADFVGEGGAIETDGDGTVMATESSLVNKNRNRGMSRDEIEDAVLEAYGADRMIWLPGIRGEDITDDHVDVTSRFVRPGHRPLPQLRVRRLLPQLPPRQRRRHHGPVRRPVQGRRRSGHPRRGLPRPHGGAARRRPADGRRRRHPLLDHARAAAVTTCAADDRPAVN